MIDFAVLGATQLVTIGEGKAGPRCGEEQRRIDVIEDGALVASEGRIVDVGTTAEIRRKHDLSQARTIDAKDKIVLPGLVDSHTHPVFAGLRYDEYALLLGGADKAEVIRQGGGIWRSVLDTREAGDGELVRVLDDYLALILRSGTTAVEAKSGYGLTPETELRHLELLRDAQNRTPLRIVPTFLGAHVVPRGMDADAYTRQIIEEMLPRVAAQRIARFHDVSCSPTTFSQNQAATLVEAGQKFGLPARIHTDGGVSSGGWEFAAKHGAVSADHLTFTPDEEIARVGATPTIAGLIPAAELVYRTSRRANARKFMEEGVAVAIATDFCSSIHCPSLYSCIGFTAAWYRMTPEEVLNGVTVNAAYAIGMGDKIGTLAPGKFADLLILNAPHYRMLAFELGRDDIETIVIGGKVV
ncbi:MAG: imidazolonepropionase [Vulcanimicrobiaceae bacterium]